MYDSPLSFFAFFFLKVSHQTPKTFFTECVEVGRDGPEVAHAGLASVGPKVDCEIIIFLCHFPSSPLL